MTNPTTGTTAGLTVLALLAFAANSVLARLALGGPHMDPASYTSVRLVSGAAILFVIARLRRGNSVSLIGGNWLSAAMLFLYAIAFSFAYIRLSTGTGALILFPTVQFTMIAIGIYAGERPQPLEWLGLLVAFIGLIYLMSPGVMAPSLLGACLMTLAGVAWGFYSIWGRGQTNPLGATADNFLRTVPFALIILAFWHSELSLSSTGLIYAVASGSIASGIGYAIWYAALRGLTATRAATVQVSVPIIAALGGVVFLSETITTRLLLSALAILGGVGTAVSSRK